MIKQTDEEKIINCRRNRKKYRENNREKIKVAKRRYYEKNKDRLNELQKKNKCYDCGHNCSSIRCRGCYNNKLQLESLTKEEIKIRNKKYRENNKEKIKQLQKEWRDKNPFKVKIGRDKWARENKDKLAINHKRWRDRNKDKCIANAKRWQKENPERDKKNHIKWVKENRGKVNKYIKKSRIKHNDRVKAYEQTPERKFSIRLRMRVITALKKYTKEGKVKSSDEYGINYEKIIEKLKPFPKDRFKYHLDHIKPLCDFKLINKDGTQNLKEIKRAFSPKNYQWLLVKENLLKGGRISKK